MPKRDRACRPIRVWLASIGLVVSLLAAAAGPGVGTGLASPGVDLTVRVTSASDDDGPTRADQFFTVTVAVSNLGPTGATDVAVRVVVPIVPDATSIVLPHQQGTFGCRIAEEPGANAVVTCQGGVVPGRGVAVIRFQMAIDEDADDAMLAAFGQDDARVGAVVTVTATVDPDDAIPENDETNNQDSERIELLPGRSAR